MRQNKINISFKFQTLFIIGLGILLFCSCNDDDKADVLFTGDDYQNILQYINADKNEEYSNFRELIEIGKIEDALSSYNNHIGGNNYTLFLPTNEAVESFIAENVSYNSFEELKQDVDYVATLVRYHLLNNEILTKDFPNGALSASTLSNDFLTVNFSDNEQGAISYKINNEAGVLTKDILKSNGVIHTIDKMLTPIAYTAYEWVEANKQFGFSIFSELLEITGLKDTMNYFELDELGSRVYVPYTLFAESDELYQKNGIQSINDLIASVSPDNSEYTNSENELNKYARYHILNSSVYLDQFKTTNYNTYGEFPVSVDEVDLNFYFNIGVEIFESRVEGEDTIDINYLTLDLPNCNIATKTGPIHQLDRLLFPFRPELKIIDLAFYNEPEITALRAYEGSFSITQENLDYISLTGTDFIRYTRESKGINGVQNRDYITVKGDFEFTYQTPTILAGEYELSLRANRKNSSNAMVQVYFDGVKAGGLLDLTNGNSSWSNFAPSFILDNLSFSTNQTHEIRIVAIKPGNLILDRLILTPASN